MAIKSLKKVPLLRDPLLHFALIGGLLFAIDSLFNTEGGSAEDIVITPSGVEHLASVFERNWQRPPNREEMQKLVDNYVREEVLYREALKLGLEADDTVIRRRLRLKMEFFARDLVDGVEPAPEVLVQFFHDNHARYRVPARVSFRQILFGSDHRAAPAEDARKLLATLSSGAVTDGEGDSHLLPRQFAQASAEEVDKQLGEGFAEQLEPQPQGKWVGPIRSEYGEHLVFIDAYQRAANAAFASVRSQVLRDWQAERHSDMLERQYQLLREHYRVRMEGSVGDPRDDSASAREVVGR
ncbi:peptidylprolyl isomerase [Microbulbifer bruguierae]|uniref:Peptidylprolyl isomerase n=1 Tax=Microbulbifer bruguierae TaxID=3029061 RepID=A0ABY8NFR0_9GAMM|nr:peptidylprolyl isomerase [Microbulbifer bruguierae]WGL17638.1 peptidylprolyl isomerase [Microbulbifer bruguierae]